MPTDPKNKLKSYSLKTVITLAIEVFVNDAMEVMNELDVNFLILDEIQIREYFNPKWLRSVTNVKKSHGDISIVQNISSKGLHLWGISRGFYIFYRGDKPTLGKKWQKQIFKGIIRPRTIYFEDGDGDGGDLFQQFQQPLEPKKSKVGLKKHTERT